MDRSRVPQHESREDFVPGGTTQHDFALRAVLRHTDSFELNAFLQAELWKAPLLATGQQRNVTGAVQLTYYPHRSYKLR